MGRIGAETGRGDCRWKRLRQGREAGTHEVFSRNRDRNRGLEGETLDGERVWWQCAGLEVQGRAWAQP